MQWLDHTSAQALGFVARRLGAESVGLIFGARVPAGDLAGLPGLEVGGLRKSDARALLDSALAGPIDARVRDRIVAETQGNPLALLELPRGLTPAELAGGFGLPRAQSGTASLSGRIEESFRRQLDALPAQARRLLMLAAAEPYGDISLVWRAAGRLGIGVQAAAPAVEAGLVAFGTRVRFRHPLARSACYRSASLADRRAAHRALVDVTDAEAEPDRRAWHRAQATAGPDEEVAAELERSAGRAQALALLTTDGPAAAAPALRQAAGAFAGSDASIAAGLRWGWIAYGAASTVWDDDGWRAILLRQVGLARRAGALDHLPILLGALTMAAVWRGDFAGAAALIMEADAATEATGSQIAPYAAMLLASLRGHQDEAVPLIEATIAMAPARGQGAAATYAHWVTAILRNGLGHYEEALAAARQASEDRHLYVSTWVLPVSSCCAAAWPRRAGSRWARPRACAAAVARVPNPGLSPARTSAARATVVASSSSPAARDTRISHAAAAGSAARSPRCAGRPAQMSRTRPRAAAGPVRASVIWAWAKVVSARA